MIETFSFGEWVGERRKELDVSQRELALKLSCALATIKKIEQDERRPSRELAGLMAVALLIPTELHETFIECARGLRPVDALTNMMANDVQSAAQTPSRLLNLPAQSTPFIGREREIADIQAYMNDPTCRLLTLVGPGGIGKTRLAIEAAQLLQARFADGAGFVSLAALSEAALVYPAIASALLLPSSDNPEARLLGYLRTKRLLLVLDNCEQLGDGVGVLSGLLAAAPGLRVLVTSRERLQLAEEWVYNVRELDDVHAIALFEQAARRTGHNLSGHEQAVMAVCKLVENLPLAIELAAGWIPFLSCEEIALHIQQDIDFLAANVRNIPERHRSVRSVFDHSWRLLSPDERTVFVKLSAFRGGWSAEESEHISGAALPVLRSMVDKSLVRLVGDKRYDLHELTRQYAAEKLREAGLESEVRWQHCVEYLSMAERLVPQTSGSTTPFAMASFARKMQQEEDNLRAGLEWAIEAGQGEMAARLTNALFLYWIGRGYWKEGLKQVDRVVTTFPNLPPFLKAKVLTILAVMLNRNGIFQRAIDVTQEAIPLAEQVGDKTTLAHLFQEVSFQTTDYQTATDYLKKSLTLRREAGHRYGIALTLQLLGDRARIHGDLEQADTLYTESIAILREIDALSRIAYPLGNRGRVAFERGDYAQARTIFEESIAICRQVNMVTGVADWLLQLALVALVQGDYEAAQSSLHENLTLCFQIGNLSEIADSLVLSAGLALSQRQFERAAKLLGASEITLEQYHNILEPSTRTRYEAYLDKTRSQIDHAAFEASFSAGRRLSIEQAVGYAMELE